LIIDAEEVEEEYPQGQPFGCCRYIDTAHGSRGDYLEQLRPAVNAQGKNFTVKDQLVRTQVSDKGHHVRKPRRNIVEASGEDPHNAAVPVYLDTDPVELEIDRSGQARLRYCFCRIRRAGRQHGLNRRADLQTNCFQRWQAATDRQLRGRCGGGQQHRGPAH
jgi:hypothetical protein